MHHWLLSACETYANEKVDHCCKARQWLPADRIRPQCFVVHKLPHCLQHVVLGDIEKLGTAKRLSDVITLSFPALLWVFGAVESSLDYCLV